MGGHSPPMKEGVNLGYANGALRSPLQPGIDPISLSQTVIFLLNEIWCCVGEKSRKMAADGTCSLNSYVCINVNLNSLGCLVFNTVSYKSIKLRAGNNRCLISNNCIQILYIHHTSINTISTDILECGMGIIHWPKAWRYIKSMAQATLYRL